MASISASMALLAAAVVAGSATTATVSNMNAIKARQEANRNQAESLAAAKAAASKATAGTTSNIGEVSLQSEEELEDAAIRSKSTKNRLRIDRTGLSLGTPLKGSSTGLSI
jgi:hypothetical protein